MKIYSSYFSGTDRTKIVSNAIANYFAKQFNTTVIDKNFTTPDKRKLKQSYSKNDIVVFGLPVYAGRLPNLLLKYLDTVSGNGATAIAIVTFGNRNYDDALIELTEILKSKSFKVLSAGAFVGEHSFSNTLGKGRPDKNDLDEIDKFAKLSFDKFSKINFNEDFFVKGNWPSPGYYKPQDHNGKFIDIRKVKPKTNDKCTDCKLCVSLCPMGSIDYDDVSNVSGICIKCGACIKKCPVGAKYYDDSGYIYHKEELENMYINHSENEWFM